MIAGNPGGLRNSLLYINFKDFEKAFDSVDKLLRHYGVPEKTISILPMYVPGHELQDRPDLVSDSFEVKTRSPP